MKSDEPILKADEVRIILQNNGLCFAESKWILLERWVCILEKVNKDINLISRSDISRIWAKHILPSLSLLLFRKFPVASRFCDFGTGGGFPGMPLAICRPDLQITLLDARHKKIKILDEMIHQLNLKNVSTFWGRGEEIGKHMKSENRFSLLTARGVAKLNQLELWTRDLRAKVSSLHVFKGGDLEQELRELDESCPGVKWEKTILTLKGYSYLKENKKTLITLNFDITE